MKLNHRCWVMDLAFHSSILVSSTHLFKLLTTMSVAKLAHFLDVLQSRSLKSASCLQTQNEECGVDQWCVCPSQRISVSLHDWLPASDKVMVHIAYAKVTGHCGDLFLHLEDAQIWGAWSNLEKDEIENLHTFTFALVKNLFWCYCWWGVLLPQWSPYRAQPLACLNCIEVYFNQELWDVLLIFVSSTPKQSWHQL